MMWSSRKDILVKQRDCSRRPVWPAGGKSYSEFNFLCSEDSRALPADAPILGRSLCSSVWGHKEFRGAPEAGCYITKCIWVFFKQNVILLFWLGCRAPWSISAGNSGIFTHLMSKYDSRKAVGAADSAPRSPSNDCNKTSKPWLHEEETSQSWKQQQKTTASLCAREISEEWNAGEQPRAAETGPPHRCHHCMNKDYKVGRQSSMELEADPVTTDGSIHNMWFSEPQMMN